MKRRIAAIAAALCVALGVVGVAATPAHASLDNCPTGKYCVWIGEAHGGNPAYYWTVPTGSGGFCVNYLNNLADNVDSHALKGGRSATQYRDLNCTGTTINFINGIAYGNPWSRSCLNGGAWACYWEGSGSYFPSSAWIIK